jgi:hypothetical protein
MDAVHMSRFARPSPTLVLFVFSFLLCGGLMIGCGSSGSSMGGGTPPGGNTQVVVLRASTANDQLVSFQVLINSVALVSKDGNSVTIFTNPASFGPLGEWMNLNGISTPLTTASVPSDTYTSAVVTVDGCSFSTESFNANGFLTSIFAEGLCAEGTGTTTVNLPSPIKITGPAMALALNLQVSQSYTVDSTADPATYTIDPMFTLTLVAITAQPTDETDGKVTVIDAQVTSVGADGKTIMVQPSDGPALTLVSNTGTVFQGIAGFSALAANMLFNFDAAIQSDGSLLATRIEVPDPMAVAGVGGPLTIPVIAPGVFLTQTLEQNGCTIVQIPFCGNIYHLNGTVFRVSGELSNVNNFPFPASFASSNFLQGQNVFVNSSGIADNRSIEEATTITLLPQTLNGTVSGSPTKTDSPSTPSPLLRTI